jgi:hypothetical protein
MDKLNRGDKLFLDKEETKESDVNSFLSCRDGIVECYEYRDESGYGMKTRLFLCENTKHECVSVIRQAYSDYGGKWIENTMEFDSDSFEFLRALITGKETERGGVYTLVRHY